MLFLKLLITGILAGIIGFYVLDRWLKSYLLSLSFGKQIVAILLLGLLYCVVFVTSFTGLIHDLTGLNVVLVWFLSLLGLFSTNTIVILILVFYVVIMGGYKEFVSIAEESLAPLIAGMVGLLFGLTEEPQQTYSIFFDEGDIAALNFITGMYSAFLCGVIAYITKKIMSNLFK